MIPALQQMVKSQLTEMTLSTLIVRDGPFCSRLLYRIGSAWPQSDRLQLFFYLSPA